MMHQMSEFGFACSRALLVALNVLCLLTAVFIFGFAVVDTRILSQYGEAEAAGTMVTDLIIIATCILLVGGAIFGCIGVVRNSVKLLYLYIGFLMILVVLEVLVAIYVALRRFGLEYKVMEYLREDFFRNTTGEELLQHNQYWDFLQTHYECCGLNGPGDYLAVGASISVSCCEHAYRTRAAAAQEQLYHSCVNYSSYYTTGCENAVLFALRESADCMLSVASMCLWFEITGMILAAIIAHNLKNRVEVYKQTTKY